MTLPGALVGAEWLAGHLGDVRVVDVRWYLSGGSGRDAHLGGHLPGAVWLDVDTELSGPASPAAGRHPLPSPERFAEALGRVGIAAGTTVVAYDDAGGSVAARLWWLLHTLGEPAAVLDGGIQAWQSSGGALETGAVPVTSLVREPVPWPRERFVTAEEVAATSSTVLDARTAARFAHGDPAIDPRPGHVPGAASVPWGGNLDGSGLFRPAAELAARFPDGPVVAYCGSGVTACHDLLALHLAGRDDTALYPGSWSQWGADQARPAESG